jgi:pseudaminic acid synthase
LQYHVVGSTTGELLDKLDYSITKRKRNSRQFPQSLYILQDIKKGEVFTEENICSVRPGYGMHTKYLKDISGKKADRDYEFGERFE